MGEKLRRILPKVATSTSLLGSFTCRKFTTWDRRLFFLSGITVVFIHVTQNFPGKAEQSNTVTIVLQSFQWNNDYCEVKFERRKFIIAFVMYVPTNKSKNVVGVFDEPDSAPHMKLGNRYIC